MKKKMKRIDRGEDIGIETTDVHEIINMIKQYCNLLQNKLQI